VAIGADDFAFVKLRLNDSQRAGVVNELADIAELGASTVIRLKYDGIGFATIDAGML
jgi:hypothetical protein